MTTITSIDNEKIKHLTKLNQKKEREESGEFFVENLKTISDALKSGFRPQRIFLTAPVAESKDLRVEELLNQVAGVYLINSKINAKFSNLETPSGIAAVFKKSLGNLDATKTNIYLNGINDPGNLGTMLRTALALGYHNIVIDEQSADIYNFKTINASKDAIFKLNIVFDQKLKVLKKIKKEMKIYATNLENGQDPQIIKDRKFCLVFGSEASGVSQEILAEANKFIRLQMSSDIESLNVAVACGIILYQLKR